MAVRMLNTVSVSAIVGIIFLFATLWNLQSREVLYHDLEIPSNVTATTEENENAASVEPVQPQENRASFLEIASKHGTDKVNPHHYNYSKIPDKIRHCLISQL